MEGKITIGASSDWPRKKTGEAGAWLVLGLGTTQGGFRPSWTAHSWFRTPLGDRAEKSGEQGLLQASRRRLRRFFLGSSRPTPIVIWSSKIAQLEPATSAEIENDDATLTMIVVTWLRNGSLGLFG